jgi:hypothetical protein
MLLLLNDNLAAAVIYSPLPHSERDNVDPRCRRKVDDLTRRRGAALATPATREERRDR